MGTSTARAWLDCKASSTYILPEKRATAEAMLRRILDYNAASASEERFVGVNVDIEPYLLPDWNDRQVLRAGQYFDLSRRFMEMVEASGQTLDVGPAIPFWFDGVEGIECEGVTQPLSRHVQDIYHYVALMDYRDMAGGRDGILRHGQMELEYAADIGKTVVVGVETDQTSLEKLTFFEEGEAAMEAELALVEEAWGGHASFGGFAIHHYRTYRHLKR